MIVFMKELKDQPILHTTGPQAHMTTRPTLNVASAYGCARIRGHVLLATPVPTLEWPILPAWSARQVTSVPSAPLRAYNAPLGPTATELQAHHPVTATGARSDTTALWELSTHSSATMAHTVLQAHRPT